MKISWKGQVSIANNSEQATITGGDDPAILAGGGFIQVGNRQLVEILGISKGVNDSDIIHLAEPWTSGNIVEETSIVIPKPSVSKTIESKIYDLTSAAQLLMDINQREFNYNEISISSSHTFDQLDGGLNHITLTVPSTTIGFTPHTSMAYTITLILKQGVGANTVQWDDVKWPNGYAPVLSYDKDVEDIITFIVTPTGTYGLVGGGWY